MIKSFFRPFSVPETAAHGCSDIYPIAQARQRVTDFIQGIPLVIEAIGILFGDNPTHFSHVAIPKVLGIRESAGVGQLDRDNIPWNDSARKALLDDMVQSAFHRTRVYLAARIDNREVGAQVISKIPESDAGMNNLTSCFIPLTQLVLEKELVKYLPESERDRFRSDSIELVDSILGQENSNNRLGKVVRYNVPLAVGQIGTDHSAQIINGELARIAKLNQVDDGTLIGLTHPHAKRTQAEIDKNEFLQALMDSVEDHEQYITPADAALILSLPSRLQKTVGMDTYIQVATMGVLLHDCNTREFIGETYLDVIKLYNSDDWDRFNNVTAIANKSGELEAVKEFYEIVKAHTVDGRTEIASP